MANVKSKTAKAEVSKAPSSKPDLAQLTDFEKPADVTEVGKPVNGPKPSTEIVPDLSDYDPQELRRVGPDLITELQLEGSVSISFHDDKLGDLAVKHGVQGLVDEFAPADAVESTYAPVIIGIRNALMASLCLATKGSAERRDIELNTAFKGAWYAVPIACSLWQKALPYAWWSKGFGRSRWQYECVETWRLHARGARKPSALHELDARSQAASPQSEIRLSDHRGPLSVWSVGRLCLCPPVSGVPLVPLFHLPG